MSILATLFGEHMSLKKGPAIACRASSISDNMLYFQYFICLRPSKTASAFSPKADMIGGSEMSALCQK
jgi:hypothetical protein